MENERGIKGKVSTPLNWSCQLKTYTISPVLVEIYMRWTSIKKKKNLDYIVKINLMSGVKIYNIWNPFPI